MSNQKKLFRYNVGSQELLAEPELARYEQHWISDLVSALPSVPKLRNYYELQTAINQLVADASLSSTVADWAAREMTLDQFRVILQEYAVDGLTEAYAMCAVIPRLRGRAQAAVMRILIDEFGCGNVAMVHANLYTQLLSELALSTGLESYIDYVNEESVAFVNIYHWLCKRAPTIDYYLGALSYTEAVIPISFRQYQSACDRLGIKSRRYFDEHVHIDQYHSRDAFQALATEAKSRPLDLGAAWVGAMLARKLGDEAYLAAVKKAQELYAANDNETVDTFEFTLAGEVFCLPSRCPHRGGSLRLGTVNLRNETITCPLHRSTFSIRTGDRLAGPECASLKVTKGEASRE